MRVELHIIAGPETGRVIRLGARELRSVGRTDRADEALPLDGKLSSVHFELETDNRFCRLRDLNSANGTEVNGAPVTECVLADGDKVTAGDTTLLVKLTGGADPSELAAVKSALSATVGKTPPKLKSKVTFTAEPCATSLMLYRGSVDQLRPGHLAEMIARTLPLHLIVDFHRLDVPPPEKLDYLFDWLPPESASAASPALIEYASYPQGFDAIEQGWGEDAIVGVFSRQDPVELRAHLRANVRAGEHSVIGYCWPSVLAPMLTFYKPKAILQFMQGIDAILVEFPDLPDTWQVFADETFADILTGLGLKQVQPELAETIAE